jgi:hypothetical protein
MFGFINKAIEFTKQQLEDCKRLPDVNSRMVFMGTFVVTSVIMLAHTIVYLCSSAKDPNYSTVMAVFAGGHGINGFARMMTKKAANNSDSDAPKA